MFILEIFIMIAAFILGLEYPKQLGWFLILVLPVLGPAGFTLISSGFMPLTMYRLGFVILMGIIFSRYYYPNSYFIRTYIYYRWDKLFNITQGYKNKNKYI